MNTEQIKKKFEELQKMHIETEWVEFKEAKKDFDFGKLGKALTDGIYCSN